MGRRDLRKPHYRRTADGQTLPAVRAADGFQNIVSGLGTDRDKAFASGYVTAEHTDTHLLAMYRSSSVAKAMVDYPADDACREWRAWQASAEQISAIEAQESRLGLAKIIRDARRRARLYGGSAIYIGTGDNDISQPLNPQIVAKGGLRYLNLIDRRELGVEKLQLDPSRDGYGMPEWYTLNGSGSVFGKIHPSRLVIFKGEEIPDNIASQARNGWGDSVLQSAMDKVQHLDGTLANIASLVFEAKVDVVKIKDFTQNLRNGGADYERLMLKRFALAMTGKGINGTLMLDAEEEYDQKSANFSTLPDIVKAFMQMVSAAAAIPMTRLFGMSPGGLNSTGEGDLRNYYDSVKQEQTLEIGPAMSLLDECLIRSALGSRPAEIHYNWRPLWQISEKDQAEIAKKLADTAEVILRTDSLPVDVVGAALVNALTELGAFPGLEERADEFFGESEQQ